MLAVQLPADVEERLAALSRATGRPETFYVREAILQHLDDLEDLYLAEQRLAAHQAGLSKSHSLIDVERELGLAD